PILGNRDLRNSYRNAVTNLTSIGIAPSRVGLMVSFATTVGFGGRNGLSPASAWFQGAEWQSPALAQVAAGAGVGSGGGGGGGGDGRRASRIRRRGTPRVCGCGRGRRRTATRPASSGLRSTRRSPRAS